MNVVVHTNCSPRETGPSWVTSPLAAMFFPENPHTLYSFIGHRGTEDDLLYCRQEFFGLLMKTAGLPYGGPIIHTA